MGTNVTTAFITCPQNPNETLGIKLPFLVMIIKNVISIWFSLKNILPLKYKFWMTKMFAEGSELQITSQQQESNLSSAQCLWDLTKDGIKFSSTCLTLLVEHMEATTYKHSEWPFMLTVESEESTFLIDSTARKSYLQSSSSFFQSRSRTHETIRNLYI